MAPRDGVKEPFLPTQPTLESYEQCKAETFLLDSIAVEDKRILITVQVHSQNSSSSVLFKALHIAIHKFMVGL